MNCKLKLGFGAVPVLKFLQTLALEFDFRFSYIDTVISHAVAYSSRWLGKPLQGLLYIKSKTHTRFILSFLAQIFLFFSLFFLNNLIYQRFFNLQSDFHFWFIFGLIY